MRLGEALSLRARQAQQLGDLRARIKANVLVQEGDEPAEDPEALLDEFEALSDDHSRLVERITRTNISEETDAGDSLITLLMLRESLRRKRNMHEQAAQAATPTRDAWRYGKSEIRYQPRVNVAAEHQKVTTMDEEIRALDARLQETNWQTDLV